MAIVRAVKTGNWSDTTVWNTGALPTSADDVYSNTFTVTIDQNITVLRLSNASTTGVTTGGYFSVVTDGITINANIFSVLDIALRVSIAVGQTLNINGTVNVSLGASNTVGVTLSSAGTVNIIGNGSNTATNSGRLLDITGSGTVNVTGNWTAGGAGCYCVFLTGANSGSLNFTGNITSGSASTSSGINNNQNGSQVTVTGNLIANIALCYTSTLINTFNHVGSAYAGGSISAISSTSLSATVVLSGPFYVSANGTHAVVCPNWKWANSSVSPTFYQIRTQNLATIRPLYTADSVGGNPAITNVRSGTVYGPANELTGTCAVPGAASVVVGVPVDNTTGTAAVTAATIRAAVGLASANLDTQLAAIPTTAAPTAAAIRTEMDSNSTKLANLDATVSSRLAASSYSAAPSAATNATAVRSELATELGRIDATVSSRLAPSGTLARVTLTDVTTTLTNAPDVPTETEIADAVRVNLTPELNRLANCSTTQEVGDIIGGAL